MLGRLRFAVPPLIAFVQILGLSAPDVAALEVAEPGRAGCEVLELPPGTARAELVPCPGVRPGASLDSDTGGCTFNFVFRGLRFDGQEWVPAGMYIGTAGHCAFDSAGSEEAWAPGEGGEVRDSTGKRIGEYAYGIWQNPHDFALIRLDPGVEPNPQMCQFGGPTGMNSQLIPDNQLVEIRHFGQGIVYGDTIPGRRAVAFGMPDPNEVSAWGTAIFGDSGSGSTDAQGRAVGVVVAIGFSGGGGLHMGHVIITRFAPQLARAEQALGLRLELVTAPQI